MSYCQRVRSSELLFKNKVNKYNLSVELETVTVIAFVGAQLTLSLLVKDRKFLAKIRNVADSFSDYFYSVSCYRS